MTHCQADLRTVLEQAADRVLHIRKPVDATKPSLAEAARREEFVRLRARVEGSVSLGDFID